MRFSKISAILLSASMFASTAFGVGLQLRSSKFDAQWKECKALDTVESCDSNEACKWIEEKASCRVNGSTARKIIAEDQVQIMTEFAAGVVGTLTLLGVIYLIAN